MNIPEIIKNRKFPRIPENAAISFIIVLVALGSFGLGRLSRISERQPTLPISGMTASAEKAGTPATTEAPENAEEKEGFIVGSKSSKKYHFPWCSGAKQLKDSNKVFFADTAEAEAAGYTKAANCRGL